MVKEHRVLPEIHRRIPVVNIVVLHLYETLQQPKSVCVCVCKRGEGREVRVRHCQGGELDKHNVDVHRRYRFR